MPERFSGMDTFLRLFDTLPKATEEELKSTLPKIGGEVLAVQKQDVAVRMGDLYRGLSVQVLDGGLVIRIGLTSAAGRSRFSLYYGRFVEFGRTSQIVRVERRRRINGMLRSYRGRKRAEDIVVRYYLPVRPAAPRPYVNTPEAQTMALDASENLASFWGRVLDRAAV